jgi:hypothetical protein
VRIRSQEVQGLALVPGERRPRGLVTQAALTAGALLTREVVGPSGLVPGEDQALVGVPADAARMPALKPGDVVLILQLPDPQAVQSAAAASQPAARVQPRAPGARPGRQPPAVPSRPTAAPSTSLAGTPVVESATVQAVSTGEQGAITLLVPSQQAPLVASLASLGRLALVGQPAPQAGATIPPDVGG